VIRTGKSEFYPEIAEELVLQGAKDAEHAEILKKLTLRSAIIVPIATNTQVLGAITLVHAESGRRYTPEDLAFAEDFARRAATAIENARLYRLEQESRARADAASRAKDEFLATVSHELRTPLNAILGWARMLNGGQLDDGKRGKAMAAVERNAVAMAELIEDLLDVSRIVSGRMRIELSPVDPLRVMEAALDAVRPAAEAKRIQIERHLAWGDWLLLGDASRLQQVVWNLLSNAVKFTPAGGRVDVYLERVDSAAEIRVTDTGRGIDPRFLPHVFAPFRQEDGSITRTHGGLGLGLAISKRLVELHQGSIEAFSEGEGRGASFRVRIPILERSSPARREPSFPPPSGEAATTAQRALAGLHVLVVEDDPDARQLLTVLLEDSGCHVRAAHDVPSALAAITSEPPDVLVSDIGLPGEDGYELIRKIRSLPDVKARKVPALALTAYARAEDRWKALRAGYLMHIPKPLEPSELITAIENLARYRE
jgi:signal transduction histidine kinase/CheY-like chemotaxis protein